MPQTSLTDRRRRLSRSLWLLGDLVGVAERRSFRSRAFRAGSWAVDMVPDPFSASRDQLLSVQGIGPGIADLIDEFASTGRIARLDGLLARLPVDGARMFALPRMTPGRLQTLKTTLGVDTLEDLVEAVRSEAVETLEGIGAATADRWLEIIALRPTPDAVSAHEAAGRSAQLRRHFEKLLGGGSEVLESGAVRRLDDWAESLDVVVVSADVDAAAVLADTAIASSSERTDTGLALRLHDRIRVTITAATPSSAGSALLASTGPTSFTTGLRPGPHPTEKGAFAALGRQWVPPPARHGPGLIPEDLVTLADIKGDLHVHSRASADGRMALEDIFSEALARGYGYVAITDHTLGLGFGGLDAAGLRRQAEEIVSVARRFPALRVFHGAEINIDRDGAPDIDDATLVELDFVVAGCHSHFDLPRPEQTERIVKAMAHPSVKVLAHPFGRRIGIRPGFQVDFDRVIGAALQHGTALEVNGHRDRMDLPSEFAARAAQAGVMLAADSDAHRVAELDNMAVAVGVLQRAHTQRTSVVNTLALSEFTAWLELNR